MTLACPSQLTLAVQLGKTRQIVAVTLCRLTIVWNPENIDQRQPLLRIWSLLDPEKQDGHSPETNGGHYGCNSHYLYSLWSAERNKEEEDAGKHTDNERRK